MKPPTLREITCSYEIRCGSEAALPLQENEAMVRRGFFRLRYLL